jgi:hypothetical protein
VEGQKNEPAGRQVRRRRACEVERPFMILTRRKHTAMSFGFPSAIAAEVFMNTAG